MNFMEKQDNINHMKKEIENYKYNLLLYEKERMKEKENELINNIKKSKNIIKSNENDIKNKKSDLTNKEFELIELQKNINEINEKRKVNFKFMQKYLFDDNKYKKEINLLTNQIRLLNNFKEIPNENDLKSIKIKIKENQTKINYLNNIIENKSEIYTSIKCKISQLYLY